MSHDRVPEVISRQFEQIFALPPNDLHHTMLTRWYKFLTRPLKEKAPVYIIFIALLSSLGIAFALGHVLIRLVTLLQYGL